MGFEEVDWFIDRSIDQELELIELIEFELIFYWIDPGVATMTDNSGDELESTTLLLGRP